MGQVALRKPPAVDENELIPDILKPIFKALEFIFPPDEIPFPGQMLAAPARLGTGTARAAQRAVRMRTPQEDASLLQHVLGKTAITDPKRLIPMRRAPAEMSKGQLNTVRTGGKPFDEQRFPSTIDVRAQFSDPFQLVDDTIKGLIPGPASPRAGSNFEAADLVELLRILDQP